MENPTPTEPTTPDRTTSTPVRPVPRPVEKSPAPEDGRASPPTMETHSETLVTKTDESRTGRLESRGEPLTLAPPAGIEDGGNSVLPDLPAGKEADDSDQRTVEPSVPAKETIAANVEDIPMENPTPAKPITSDRTASTSSRPVPRSAETHPAPEDALGPPSTMVAHSETVAGKTDESRTGRLEFRKEEEVRGETPALASPAGIEDGGNPMPADLSAVEEADDSERRTVEPSVPAKETMVAGDEYIPVQNPVDVFFPDEQAQEPLQTDPREESTSQRVAEPPVSAPGYPKVHIGLLEVLVSAPENASVRKISNAPAGHNFASRHYLRNF